MRHVQAPDEENRQDGESEVANDGDGAVEEGETDDDVNIDASSALDMSIPEETNWRTLEQCDEEEDESHENGEPHGKVDDPFVDVLDGNAEKEKANGYLRCNHSPAVGNIT